MINKLDIWNKLKAEAEPYMILADKGKKIENIKDYDPMQLLELSMCNEEVRNQKVAEAGDLMVTRMFSHLRSNLFDWLPAGQTEKVLFIGADAGCFAAEFAKKAEETVCLETDLLSGVVATLRLKATENVKVICGDLNSGKEYLEEGQFKYIIFSEPLVLNKLEEIENCHFVQMVFKAKKYLKPGGNIIFASENTLGIKYWSGCRDEVTDGYFSGLENYMGAGGCGFPDKDDIKQLIKACGFKYHLMYYPYPDFWFPTSIYSDEYLPQEGELTKNAFSWEDRLVLFNEVNVWNNIIKNGLFPSFSNSFLVVMSDQDILDQGINMFTKYSNDRNGKFSIRTDIYVGSDGARHVKKAGLTEQGRVHLAKMLRWKRKLEKIYEGTCLAINQIAEINGEFEFEYLRGTPLLDVLTKCLEEDDFEGFYHEFCRLIDVLKERNQEEFFMTEGFKKVFGDLRLPAGLKCGKISNIDLIVQNILLTGSCLNMIDYEWVFDFPVPVNFIIYRSIIFFFKGPRGTYNFNKLYQSQLLDRLGIDEEECALYEIMEANFQEYICGTHIPLRKIGVKFPHRVLPMSPQIYLDFGRGYKRQNSYYALQQLDGKGIVELKIGVTSNMTGVRIDPANVPCIVRILELKCGGKENYNPDYQVNGKAIGKNIIIYNTIDSQIHINELQGGTTYVYAKLKIIEMEKEIIEGLIEN